MPISFLRANSVSHNPHIALNDLQDGIIALNKHVHHFTQPTHNCVKQLNQVHDLPHLPYCIIAPMHQCMFMVFIQIYTLIIQSEQK